VRKSRWVSIRWRTTSRAPSPRRARGSSSCRGYPVRTAVSGRLVLRRGVCAVHGPNVLQCGRLGIDETRLRTTLVGQDRASPLQGSARRVARDVQVRAQTLSSTGSSSGSGSRSVGARPGRRRPAGAAVPRLPAGRQRRERPLLRRSCPDCRRPRSRATAGRWADVRTGRGLPHHEGAGRRLHGPVRRRGRGARRRGHATDRPGAGGDVPRPSIARGAPVRDGRVRGRAAAVPAGRPEGELVNRVVSFVEAHSDVTRVAQVCAEFG
jgi:hypothetical protein